MQARQVAGGSAHRGDPPRAGGANAMVMMAPLTDARFSGPLPHDASKDGGVLMMRNRAGSDGLRCRLPVLRSDPDPLTSMLELEALEPSHDTVKSWHLLERPEQLANCALLLVSDETSVVMGHALGVDGGWTAARRVPTPDIDPSGWGPGA